MQIDAENRGSFGFFVGNPSLLFPHPEASES